MPPAGFCPMGDSYSVVKKADPDVGKGGNAHLYRALKQGGAL